MKILHATTNPVAFHLAPPLSPEEVVCGPHFPDRSTAGRVVSLATPQGDYDIAAVAARLPHEQRPDLVVVRVDASGTNQPRNLGALGCRAVLVVGDTHHLPQPIGRALRYALSEPFEMVLLDFTRHHAHFFIEAGLSRVYWLPGFNVGSLPVPADIEPDLPLTLIGQTGKWHPRRTFLCQALAQAKLPLQVGMAEPAQTRLLHARSRINLNCSLNGDFNLRVFEVLLSRGFLLTDRLSPQTGLARLFTDGEHLLTYASIEDCIDRCARLLRDPAPARRVAAAGHARVMQSFAPERIRRDFFALLAEGIVRPEFDLADDRRNTLAGTGDGAAVMARIEQYERVQAIHLGSERARILVTPDVDRRHLCDIADLPRLAISVVEAGDRPPPVGAVLAAAGVADQITVLPDWATVVPGNFDLVIESAAGWQRGHSRAVVAQNRSLPILIADAGPTAQIAAELAAAGLRPVPGRGPLYARAVAAGTPFLS